jgi:PIN domain nuclease of toxin-antitoxin system
MIILDTHAWIWWNSESPLLSENAKSAIENASQIGICSISIWELSMLVSKGRIGFKQDLSDWIEKALKVPKLKLLYIEPPIAIKANNLPGELHGDPADRIIAATTIINGSKLVSKDRQLLNYPYLETIW